MDRQTPIMDAVGSIADNAKAMFCMPGHKGDTGYYCGEMLKSDITELPGSDNLIDPKGAISESQELHAKFTGAQAAFYTTGGSTAGVLAMLSLFRGKKVIFPRGVHVSAANAVFSFGITPVILSSSSCDYPCVVSAEEIGSALRQSRDAAAVFIVYPNYFGLCCDIEEIARVVHKAGIPLLVDAAHAAHFIYSPLLPLAPSRSGADIWIESTHKTLPAMNQCACLCVGQGSLLKSSEVKQALSVFQTTSPSYILLSSIDYAHAYMRDKGERELFRIVNLTRRLEDMVNGLPGFCCPVIEEKDAKDRDRLKVIIDVSGTGYTGISVKETLARQGIHIEAADVRNMLLMLSPGNTSAQLELLFEALRQIKKIYSKKTDFSPYSMPEPTKYSQNSRGWGNIEKVRLEEAAGRISASAAGVYPPAEAVVYRGQLISPAIAGYLLEAKRQGFEVFGTDGASISVYKEKA